MRKPPALTLLLLFGLLLTGCTPRPSASRSAAPVAPAANIVFADVARTAGLNCTRANGGFGKKWMPETVSGGGAFLDYDNDGWLDILIVTDEYLPGSSPNKSRRPTLALYHNKGNGTFTDVTQQAGLNLRLFGMGVAVGDYDNDGYDDLFITAVGQSKLFHNVPDGHGGRKFAEVTASSGIRDTGMATSAAWLDYDKDGKLDLFVCHYVKWSPQTDVFCGTDTKEYCRPTVYAGESSRLYHNEGNGRFTDVTQKAGLVNPNSKGLGICVCDLDGDDWPDLVVANDMEANSVFRNRGNGTFEEIGLKTGIALDDNGKPRAGMGIDAADYKNNGTFGIAIGNFAFEGLAFYEVTGQPPFVERAKQIGLFESSYPFVTFGVLFADFDNDGWPDLFATNGHIQTAPNTTNPEQILAQHGLLFRNRGDGTFADVSQQAGAAIMKPTFGRGACWGDYDNDGRVDLLLIPNIGAPALLHNETPTRNHWLAVKLVGTKSNRDAYGAKVVVEAGGVTRTG
ncbi:MAG TPA: VCBS repeat-containing protein, partial [Chthonomonadaceae bacterium]|nr:VCBS repeat-containing protein [Chthonomonadaceae bacterium]